MDPNSLLDSVAFLNYAGTGILCPVVVVVRKLLTNVMFRRRFWRSRCREWLTLGRLCELRLGHPVLAVHWVSGVYRPEQFLGFSQVTVGV
ncbi:MAG: hypothetical protein GY696_29660 [Gammaproteobacteria bacterium]|nr:hypothetical protein [Gammaproteobacteria bacterium]